MGLFSSRVNLSDAEIQVLHNNIHRTLTMTSKETILRFQQFKAIEKAQADIELLHAATRQESLQIRALNGFDTDFFVRSDERDGLLIVDNRTPL